MKALSNKTKNALMTSVTASCIIATGISAAVGSFEAAEKLRDLDRKKKTDLVDLKGPSTWKKIKTIAPCYSWSVLFGAGALLSLYGSYRSNSKAQSALISAYTLVDKAYSEYRLKNIELNGKEKDDEIMKAIAFGREDDVVLFDGETLFYDEFSGRYFKSTLESVTHAQDHANALFLNDGYLDLSDYYELLGLDRTDYAEMLGWSEHVGYSTYGYTWIHFENTLVTSDKGFDYYKITFPFRPTTDYYY